MHISLTRQAEEELDRRKSILAENKSRFCSKDHFGTIGDNDDVDDDNVDDVVNVDGVDDVDDVDAHRLRDLTARVLDLESQMLSL